jgi:hypothetical protein
MLVRGISCRVSFFSFYVGHFSQILALVEIDFGSITSWSDHIKRMPDVHQASNFAQPQ